jgi:ParB family chromosome partitioning protein
MFNFNIIDGGKNMGIQNGWVNTDSLTTDKDFESLYSRKEKLTEAIARDMHEKGYDEAMPIICWEREGEDGHGSLIVIDGHTRLLAAKKAGLQEVLVRVLDFSDKDTALLHAIHYQRDRRNISDADIYICTGVVDKRKPRGGDRKSKSAKSKALDEAIDLGKSAERTAVIVGTSRAKIERVRFIKTNADEQTKQDVRECKKTINRAYNETIRKLKAAQDDENQEESNAAQEDNELLLTFQRMLEKLLAVVKQAKADGWQGIDKQIVVDGLKKVNKLLKE